MFLPGLWWQGHTIRGRLKKTWDEFEESRPKPKVNWNRNAKRAPPPPKPKEPKGKPKTMPKPKDPSPPPKSDMVIEDIEFKTPPLTPPAVLLPPPPVKVAPDEDDDFWDFYGQGLPLPWLSNTDRPSNTAILPCYYMNLTLVALPIILVSLKDSIFVGYLPVQSS